jgi:hypothetical protein
VRLPQSSADLVNELLAFFVELPAQPFRERCCATIEDVGLWVSLFERGCDRRKDPGSDHDLSAIFRPAHSGAKLTFDGGWLIAGHCPKPLRMLVNLARVRCLPAPGNSFQAFSFGIGITA